jgi:hypothetical protein
MTILLDVVALVLSLTPIYLKGILYNTMNKKNYIIDLNAMILTEMKGI